MMSINDLGTMNDYETKVENWKRRTKRQTCSRHNFLMEVCHHVQCVCLYVCLCLCVRLPPSVRPSTQCDQSCAGIWLEACQRLEHETMPLRVSRLRRVLSKFVTVGAEVVAGLAALFKKSQGWSVDDFSATLTVTPI